MKEDPQERIKRCLEYLSVERPRWLAFLRRRVSDADAEDILQECLLRAMRRVEDVRREEDLYAWFYRVLHRAVIDTYRKEGAVGRRNERFLAEVRVSIDAERRAARSERVLCACMGPRLSHLRPRYASLLNAVDIHGKAPAAVAAAEKVSLNSLHVTLHRARRALHRELLRHCGTCAENACLDCSCEPDAGDGISSENEKLKQV